MFEIDESYSDEVIIRCSNYNDDIRVLQDVIGKVLNIDGENNMGDVEIKYV